MLDRAAWWLRGAKALYGRQGFHPFPPGADGRKIWIHGLGFRRKAKSEGDGQQLLNQIAY